MKEWTTVVSHGVRNYKQQNGVRKHKNRKKIIPFFFWGGGGNDLNISLFIYNVILKFYKIVILKRTGSRMTKQ